jgi:hypothetical protein
MLRLGESWFKARLGKKNVRSHLNRKKLSMVVCAYHSNYGKKTKIGGSQSRLGENQDLISKITRAQRTARVVQVVEPLPGKYKALVQTPVSLKFF